MKALELLKADRDYYQSINNDKSIIEQYNEAIKELEYIKKNITTSIEEIDYALAKPEYAENYLGNAKRFLMKIQRGSFE